MVFRIPTSRDADKFVIRLPEGMRKSVGEFSAERQSSMNNEIVLAIENHLLNHTREALLIEALLAQQAAATMSNHRATADRDEVVCLDTVKNGTK